MSTQTLLALATAPLFAGINSAALEMLDSEGILRTFTVGDLIVREGEAGHSFFILVEGDVEIIKQQGDNPPVVLANLHRRTFFGEMCVVDPVPRAATVRATSAVKAVELKSSSLYHLFQKMPEQYSIVLLNLARDMARRLRALDEAFAARTS
jgi:CRP-like cAMP-binding protein